MATEQKARLAVVLTCVGWMIPALGQEPWAAVENRIEHINPADRSLLPPVPGALDFESLNRDDLIGDVNEHFEAVSSYRDDPGELSAQLLGRISRQEATPSQVFAGLVLDGILTNRPEYFQVRDHILNSAPSKLQDAIWHYDLNPKTRRELDVAMLPLRQSVFELTSLPLEGVQRTLDGLFLGNAVDSTQIIIPGSFNIGSLDRRRITTIFYRHLNKVSNCLTHPKILGTRLTERILMREKATLNHAFAWRIFVALLTNQGSYSRAWAYLRNNAGQDVEFTEGLEERLQRLAQLWYASQTYRANSKALKEIEPFLRPIRQYLANKTHLNADSVLKILDVFYLTRTAPFVPGENKWWREWLRQLPRRRELVSIDEIEALRRKLNEGGISIGQIRALSAKIDNSALLHLRGRLAEMFVFEALGDDMIAHNIPLHDEDGNSIGEIDAETRDAYVEVASGEFFRNGKKARQLNKLAKVAKDAGRGLIVYYDPDRNDQEKIERFMQGLRKEYEVSIETRPIPWN